MNLAGNFFDEALRRGIRETIAEVIPADKIDEVADLAVHAAETAINALGRIAFAGQDARVGICASSIAIGILAHRLAELNDVLRHASAETGIAYREATISVQR